MMSLLALAFELGGRGIALRSVGERLLAHPPESVTPELAAAIREHKAELIPLLETRARETTTERPMGVAVDPASVWEDLPEPGEPCPTCGSLLRWWDGRDVAHCMRCDPPTRSLELWRRAERVRRRLRKPAPPETVERMQRLERLIQNRIS